MNPQVKHRRAATQKSAATKGRNFRTFLLVSQFEAAAIGARLAQARREAGMTQEQVSDVASFSKRSLQDYEAGVTIPWPHFRELAAIYRKPVEWLIHGEDPEKEDLSTRVDQLQSQLDEVLGLLRERPDTHRETDS